MDNIDKKIINLLQDNARHPLKFLASKVFLSSPAVSARIDKLEKDGIITGYHAEVDPILLGYHVITYLNATVLQVYIQCLLRLPFQVQWS